MRTNPTQQLMLQMKPQPCQNTSCAFDQPSHQEKISHYWILTCSIYWVSRRGGGGAKNILQHLFHNFILLCLQLMWR